MKIEPNLEILNISPAMAKGWLDKNTFENRGIKETHVSKIVKDIKNGRWVFDGSPIRFDTEGNVLDGQHRLWAIFKSGQAVRSAVLRNLSHDVVDVIDTGRSRNASDVLHFHGNKNANVLAAVARLYMGYSNFNKNMIEYRDSKMRREISIIDVLKIVDENPAMANSVNIVVGMPMVRKIMGASMAGFCHFIFSQIDTTAANEFFYLFDKGAKLDANHPILTLKNFLVIHDRSTDYGGNHAGPYKIALIIKTWNAFRENRTIQKLLFRHDTESYPIPV